MTDYLRVDDIEKYYGSGTNVTKAIDRVSFRVEKGEFVGVMGASGSGKTTLLNLLATIDQVTAGHIYYETTDITELSEEELSEFRKANLGFVFQEYNLLDTLTIEENILLALTLQGGGREQIERECDRMIKLLELEEIRDKFPYQVSGGQKQRCACARAVSDPGDEERLPRGREDEAGVRQRTSGTDPEGASGGERTYVPCHYRRKHS